MNRAQQLYGQITSMLWDLEEESEWVWVVYALKGYFTAQRAYSYSPGKAFIKEQRPKNHAAFAKLIDEYLSIIEGERIANYAE